MLPQDLHVRKTFAAGPLSAPLIPLFRFLARYKFVTYFTYLTAWCELPAVAGHHSFFRAVGSWSFDCQR